METTNHFPWTTSMMVFVIDRDNRFLLKKLSGRWGTFQFDTTGEVDIRKMVCAELYTNHILTSPECLEHQGVLDNENKTFFIYTTNEFVTNYAIPPKDYLWHPSNNIPFKHLSDFERHVLIMILDGKKIGVKQAPEI